MSKGLIKQGSLLLIYESCKKSIVNVCHSDSIII